MPEQPGQLPTQINSQALATLFPGGAPSGTANAPVLPQPAAPAGGGDPVSEAVAKSIQFGTTQAPEQLARARAAGGAATEAINQPVPEMPKGSWLDPGPGKRPGEPGYHRPGFLGDLVKVLEAIGSATGPGQAIQEAQYGPGVSRWKAEYGPTGTRAQTIAALQKQQTTEQEPLGPLTTGPGRVMAGAGAEKRGEAAQSTAAVKAQAERDRHSEQLTRLEQNATALGLKGDALAALKQYHQAYLQSFDRRTQAQEDVAMAETGARQDAMASSNLSRYESANPILGPLLNAFGIGGPVAPAGAGTETPAAAAAKGAGRAAKPAKAGATPPARPKGVPADAQWDAKSQTWYK